jgi:hypothetical protein
VPRLRPGRRALHAPRRRLAPALAVPALGLLVLNTPPRSGGGLPRPLLPHLLTHLEHHPQRLAHVHARALAHLVGVRVGVRLGLGLGLG